MPAKAVRGLLNSDRIKEGAKGIIIGSISSAVEKVLGSSGEGVKDNGGGWFLLWSSLINTLG